MTTTANAPVAAGVLQMIRAEVSVRDFQRWMGARRLQDPDHAVHCLLTECFGDLAPRPFRLMTTRGGATASLYGYGQATAEELRDAAAICACPIQARILPASRIDSKPMPSEFPAGKRLGFDIRIRPIVRLQRDLDRVPPDKLRLFREDRRNGEKEFNPRPGMECDVFQWQALLHPKGGMNHTREQVYAQWLAERFRDKGAVLDVDTVSLVSFQRTRAHRKLHRRHIEGPDAVMQGVLTVTNPGAFTATLRQGIGRHRAYGYGMLLLRPARQ